MTLLKGIATAVALTIGATALTGTASADRRYWRHHHNGHGDAVAAGIIGLGAGALIGGALAQPRYYEPAPVYQPEPVYVQPEPVYSYYEPWSAQWYDYCAGRYRSFDARTGYYVGYDQRLHFCR